MLPDGRLLISQFYYGDNENIVLIENDFSTRTQFSLNLEFPPLLHLAQDGIIMISANPNFGTSVIAKYDFNFTKLWSKSLSQIRPFFSHYDSQAN